MSKARIDTDKIKREMDCRTLIERDLGKPKRRTRDYHTYKCPLHRERKGYSLVVYADHWHCFGKCGSGGDVIGWLMRYHRMSFVEACQCLTNGNLPLTNQPIAHSNPLPEPPSEPPDAEWQKSAQWVAEEAAKWLWQPPGRRALDYLRYGRGLDDPVIRAAQLGYVPGDSQEWKTIAGLTVPCGITIPWYGDGALWGIKVRRAAGEIRYQQVSGGNLKGGLYLADQIQSGLPLFLTEGEFDALIAWQAGWGIVSVTSIGGAGNHHLNPRWYIKLLGAPRILVRMDADNSGIGASAAVTALSSAMKPVQVPLGKDVNEFLLLSGVQAVTAWLQTIIE